MRKRKDFAPRGALSRPEPNEPHERKVVSMLASGRVHFPVNSSGKRTHDFSPFYGKSIDEVVKLVQEQIERLLRGEDKCVATATIVGACNSLTHFLKHLETVAETKGRALAASDIDDEAISGFLATLSRSGMQANAQKKRYDFVKLVLVQLLQRGKISLEEGFPPNPFPHSNRLMKGAIPYTSSQRIALAKSLRAATAPVFESNLPGIAGDQLALCFLAVALRTGVNLTPLLELRLDDIKPHVKAGMKLLITRKRRGGSQTVLPFRSTSVQEAGAVLPSVARLLDKVIQRTAALRDAAPEKLKSSVWIFRSGAQRNYGKIIALTVATVRPVAAKLAKEFRLYEEDGRPLAINVPRMRKTFVNRVYELSAQNIIVAARAAGHTPRVAATNYLVPNSDAERNWKFMGEALVEDLMRDDGQPFHATPSGKCRDIRGGEFAPKNGALCINYLDCFRCRSYVVTANDLHKVFSLYWMVIRERDGLPRSKWKRVYAHLIRTVDEDIVEAGIKRGVFDRKFAMEERQRAAINPHPFWRSHGRD